VQNSDGAWAALVPAAGIPKINDQKIGTASG
jgi:hypothetical protein